MKNKPITIDGEQFELVNMDTVMPSKALVLKPIQQEEEKKEYYLSFYANFDNDFEIYRTFELTEPQAQAISEALYVVLKYIQGKQEASNFDYDAKIVEAHQLLNKSGGVI